MLDLAKLINAFIVVGIGGVALMVGFIIYLLATQQEGETRRERESFLNWGDDC